MAQELRDIISNAVASGYSDDDIRGLGEEHRRRQATATPPTADNPRPPRIEADERGVMGRVDDYLQYADGIPGVLVGAVKKASGEASALGDLGRAAWNTVAPEAFDVDRPYRDDPAVSAGLEPRNRYQDFGQDAITASEWAGGVRGVAKVASKFPGVISRALGMNKERAGARIGQAVDTVKAAAQNPRGAFGFVRTATPAATSVPTAGTLEAGRAVLDYDRIKTIPMAARTYIKRHVLGDAPMDIDRARKFSSSLGRSTSAEKQTSDPDVRRLVIQMKATIDDAIKSVMDAETGDLYQSGIDEYARAKRMAERWEKLYPTLISTLKWGAGISVAGKIYQDVRE